MRFKNNTLNSGLKYVIFRSDAETGDDSIAFYYSDELNTKLKSLIVMDVPASDSRKPFELRTAHVPEGRYRLVDEYKSAGKVSVFNVEKPILIKHDQYWWDIDSTLNFHANVYFEGDGSHLRVRQAHSS